MRTRGVNFVLFKAPAGPELKRYFRKFPELKIVDQRDGKEIVMYWDRKGIWNSIEEIIDDIESADCKEYIIEFNVDFA